MISQSLAYLPLLCVWGIAGTALVVIDIRTHRLPNRIVFSLYPLVVLALALAGALGGLGSWTQALMGAGIWFLLLGAVWLVTSGKAMGFGDVKLAPLLGLSLGWFGWEIATVGVICAWFLGGIYAGLLILIGRAQRSSAIAFGPFLIAGFWIAVALGPWLARGEFVGHLG